MAIDLIYCADGNERYAKIAIDAGFLYGAQVPNKVYFSPYFCDQDFKNPNLKKYLAALAEHKPTIASVLDWAKESQLSEVIMWAEEVALFADTIVIIPKVIGGVERIPAVIGGKPVRLGYSVPTGFGGTSVPYNEFKGRDVHLLGGSPQKQRGLTRYMNAVSLDGNMHQKTANKFCKFFDPWKTTRQGLWPSIAEYDGRKWRSEDSSVDESKKDAPYEAFRRSCKNIMAMWRMESIEPNRVEGKSYQIGFKFQ
jgi:hypothetical protein